MLKLIQYEPGCCVQRDFQESEQPRAILIIFMCLAFQYGMDTLKLLLFQTPKLPFFELEFVSLYSRE